MRNNLQHNREELVKATAQSRKGGLGTGFEYAIQPDGSVMAERRWMEQRRQPHGCFKLYRPSNQDDSRIYQSNVSLSNISTLVQQGLRRHAEHQRLPAAAAANIPSNLPPAPVSTNTPPTTSTITGEGSFLSPTRRIRNRHNAVYGEHLPTAQNSPGCAEKVFGKRAVQQQERNRCQDLFNTRNESGADSSGRPTTAATDQLASNYQEPTIGEDERMMLDNDDEDYDALFASVDVEALMAPTTSNKENSSTYNQSSMETTSYNNHGPSTSFQASTNTSSASVGYPNTYQAASSHPTSYPQSHYDMPSSGNADPSAPSHPTSYPQSHYDMPSSGNADPSAPLCPGHGVPCRALTASTSANMGRKFYKCSFPDDQKCDFFEWADGMEGNWNNADGDGGGVADGVLKDVRQQNAIKFGHQQFRPGQKEVIDNAVAGRDVFVLMPTGGGKSLCYQLPAWCCPGLSVVISPLLSLIQDQVQSMTKLGIESVYLASSQEYEEQQDIIRRINDTTAHGGVKLLYLTPEKLSHSGQMQSILRRLYNRKLISRFVIDEAHCLSDWGHDFRPDYNRLNILRSEFPNVPLMALTATANEKVVNDAIRALGMKNPYRYVSSFNRPNLRYEVRKKDSKTIEQIADYVASRRNDSGVIYCLSRKDCETLSAKVQDAVRSKPGCRNVRVSFYHAELDAAERERRHRDWSNGLVSVLCATVAFGMGIDKPDVRYVIHYSMPKSITHYYQESGRAGRDREVADCILYYSYKDKKILENMIIKSSNDPYGQATRRKVDQLYSCVRYCEDDFQCRRTIQLDFFGERFDKSKCKRTCDNCRAGREPDRQDLTEVARSMLVLLRSICEQRKNGGGVTLSQLCELYRGSKSKSAVKFLDTNRLRNYGAGKKYNKSDLDRIAHAMVFDRILVESSEQNKGGFTTDYVHAGENAERVEGGSLNFFVNFPHRTTRSTKSDTEKPKRKKKESKKTAVSKKSTAPAPKRKAAIAPKTYTLDDSSDDDSLPVSSGSKKEGPSVLPMESTKKLVERIKTLVTNWAQEERIYGKNVFYWNILSNEAMKAIAAQVPMSTDDLIQIGVLGENVVKEYGDRIVKAVTCFVEQEGLHQHIQRRPSKRQKVALSQSTSMKSTTAARPPVIEIGDDDGDDEKMLEDIDFSNIELPAEAINTSSTNMQPKNERKSPYF